MSDLIEEAEGGNAPEFSVTELSGAVKRMIEGEFSHIRVRGELGRISRPASGHIYLTLKDDRSNLDAVIWKGTAARLTHRPEEGMEVVATGRMTTFAGQSKYQLVIEDMRPAGAGALMAMLEQRRMKLAAEGLFDAARKQELPFLPEVIGVVTSPSGAVIRDILHRLRDRFPRQVLIWPVAVQGEKCAPEVAAGIRGFNALAAGGHIPRPDLIIVARGGGSLEDLWGFNEEIVVRAAAESRIPLISAVGHETDTTLIDFAADYRAPTPTAAAERAVPVRMDILTWVQDCGARLSRGAQAGVTQRRVRLADLSRALPRPASLLETAQQRLDRVADRLEPALVQSVQTRSHHVQTVGARLVPALDRSLAQKRLPYERACANLRPSVLSRAIADAQQKLNALERMRQSLGYTATLKRGYAVLRNETGLITTTAALRTASKVEVELADGKAQVKPLP
jgi:exodeoxyribonuclease VII large subunit